MRDDGVSCRRNRVFQLYGHFQHESSKYFNSFGFDCSDDTLRSPWSDGSGSHHDVFFCHQNRNGDCHIHRKGKSCEFNSIWKRNIIFKILVFLDDLREIDQRHGCLSSSSQFRVWKTRDFDIRWRYRRGYWPGLQKFLQTIRSY